MKQDINEYRRAYYQAHKEEIKARSKAWNETHKDVTKARSKAWNESHKEEYNGYRRAYHKDNMNSLGESKNNIRRKSNYYLSKHGTKIPGYQIHHCCTYTEPYKFIYCSKEMHQLIHSYLRQHNIDADSDHYDLIKHLLDDTVVLYGL